jgi:hypothetical protein
VVALRFLKNAINGAAINQADAGSGTGAGLVTFGITVVVTPLLKISGTVGVFKVFTGCIEYETIAARLSPPKFFVGAENLRVFVAAFLITATLWFLRALPLRLASKSAEFVSLVAFIALPFADFFQLASSVGPMIDALAWLTSSVTTMAKKVNNVFIARFLQFTNSNGVQVL